MIKIERTSVMNFENAIRGARNPMNSWGRMDSHTEPDGTFVFGENDLSLAKRLCKAGTDHRKFIRQIFVSVDLTAPIYWWKEFDTYKVGTVANSTSTMHKIQAKTFEEADFSCDRMVPAAKESLMLPDGSYCRKHSAVPFDSQDTFMQQHPHIPAAAAGAPKERVHWLKDLAKKLLWT